MSTILKNIKAKKRYDDVKDKPSDIKALDFMCKEAVTGISDEELARKLSTMSNGLIKVVKDSNVSLYIDKTGTLFGIQRFEKGEHAIAKQMSIFK